MYPFTFACFNKSMYRSAAKISSAHVPKSHSHHPHRHPSTPSPTPPPHHPRTVAPSTAQLPNPKIPQNPPKQQRKDGKQTKLTSQHTTPLQMIDTLPPVTLAHLIPDQSRHHALHPLFPQHRVLGGFEGGLVVVVDAVEGWRYFWLAREEGG